MTQMLVAPGPGDSAEHALFTRLIVEHKGIPDSYRPLLPIDHFGSYPVGFHTIAAMMILLDTIQLHRETFFISAFTYVLITLALYLFLYRWFHPVIAAITSTIVMIFSTYPQLIFHWGGNPTALGFFFAIMSTILLEEAHKTFSVTTIIVAALCSAATLLTHVNPALTLFYVYGFFALARLPIITHSQQTQSMRLFCIFIPACLILIASYLTYFEFGFSAAEQAEFMKKPYDHAVSVSTSMPKQLYVLLAPAMQLVGFTSIPLIVLGFAGAITCFRKKMRQAIPHCIFFCSISILIMNAYYWLLPLTFALFPDRISLFFILPVSYFVGISIQEIRRFPKLLITGAICFFVLGAVYYTANPVIDFVHSPYGIDRTSVSFSEASELALFQLFGGPFFLYLFGMQPDSVVTEADISVFAWIQQNIPENSMFLNNPGSAGSWIPALAYRPILFPHVPGNLHTELFTAYNLTDYIKVNPDKSSPHSVLYNFSLLIAQPQALKERGVRYVYTGPRSIFNPVFTERDFPDRKVVYMKEGVIIYQLDWSCLS